MEIPKARPLTYEEHEELIEAGLDRTQLTDEQQELPGIWARKLTAHIIKKAYPELEGFSKSLPSPTVRKLAMDTYVLTLRGEEEIKNS
jgi:hypothetical protein